MDSVGIPMDSVAAGCPSRERAFPHGAPSGRTPHPDPYTPIRWTGFWTGNPSRRNYWVFLYSL